MLIIYECNNNRTDLPAVTTQPEFKAPEVLQIIFPPEILPVLPVQEIVQVDPELKHCWLP